MNKEKLFNEIKDLSIINSFSKHEQLVQGIINGLNHKLIAKGDMLPSVNEMMRETGFAKETIGKAYKELISRGILESKNRMGYFVATDDTEQHLKVCLLIYAFDTFQETFYQNFRDHLGDNIQVDVYFHHNNFSVFESIINSNKGQYGLYVIAPIESNAAKEVLEQLPKEKLLIVDRYVKLKGDYSYIVQEFEKASYNAFLELAPRIKEFSEFVFFFKPSSAEPNEVLISFKRFIKEFNINGVIKNSYEAGSIAPDKVYFTIHNLELWEMLKDTRVKGLKVGKDLGILSHNDDNVKEIIFDGITTFSIDFAHMGRLAAEFVLNLKPIKQVMENKLIRRNSL
ncbi:GntR family transcriptional regulator [Pedobacter roseus]|jgi:DNA-binding transcriptional regulator YhcF (GntR family)|uniref:GntR family transcriptional regulator n=1 Tax=Pedobacter roseus TaxID=336820 RepID=A0A7G9QN13_9SPHI|nr:GntR family transcriptional regulator [Pedobacter roseus]QNN44738.1 GntR family transcriptional regulator [Pedobacter roseus]